MPPTSGVLKNFVFGPLETNCYLLRDQASCYIFDPGLWPEELVQFCREMDLRPERIVLTHGHGDHIAGVNDMLEAFAEVPILCPRGDAAMLRDPSLNLSDRFGLPLTVEGEFQTVEPGEEINLGSTSWQVLDTAGHTPGGVSYYCRSEGVVITGDALFAGSVGRTDIPGGDHEQLLRSIRENLLTLPEETVILPGHGPATTVRREKSDNPFLS
jgi:glyoxylase-like metal-dependent hydrolase (beta-lactamase superfamily II)